MTNTQMLLFVILVIGCCVEALLGAFDLDRTVPVTGILVAVLAVVLQVPQVRRVWLRLTRASVEDLALRSFSETFRLMSALFGPRATLMLRTGSDNR